MMIYSAVLFLFNLGVGILIMKNRGDIVSWLSSINFFIAGMLLALLLK